jgi:AraC-like DNA-binding protein
MEVIHWIVLLGFAVLVTAIVVSLYYRHKYDPIFCQLSELLGDKDLGETNKLAYKLADKTNKPAEKPTERTDKTIDNPTNIAKNETVQEDMTVEGTDGELYKQLTDAIRNEQLYTTAKFGRQDMMKRFHMTSKRISTLFSMAGTSVPEFIRECRLEHARQLIDEHPEMTLVEISKASGFVHASTFTVDFKNKYGVSPTKYREQTRRDEI